MDFNRTALEAASEDPAVGLRAVVALRRLTDRLEVIQVTAARQGRMDLATDRRRPGDHPPGGPQEIQEVAVFERFTRAAREVVTSAIAIADDRGDSRVGTEHLLAGVAASSSRAADLLDAWEPGRNR